MKAYGLTHKGWVRKNNEDRFLIKELSADSVMLAVADGMGGQAGGEIASQIVMDVLANFDPHDTEPSADLLLQLIIQANSKIREKAAADSDLLGMGTTATLSWITGHQVYWGHVGDSRLYHYYNNELHQITTDHNLAGMMVQTGELTPEQARNSPMRNILQQCVGCKNCKPETGQFAVGQGDLVLLCTDGLCGAISHKKIARLLAEPASAQDKVEALVNKALKAGGSDNVTVVFAEI